MIILLTRKTTYPLVYEIIIQNFVFSLCCKFFFNVYSKTILLILKELILVIVHVIYMQIIGVYRRMLENSV